MYIQYSTDHGEEVFGTVLAAAVLTAGQLHHLKKYTSLGSTLSVPHLLEGHHPGAELAVPPQQGDGFLLGGRLLHHQEHLLLTVLLEWG